MSEQKITPDLLFAESIRSQKRNIEMKYAADSRILYEWVGSHWKPLDQEKEVEAIAWRWLATHAPEKATARAASACAMAAILHANNLPGHQRAPNIHATIPTASGVVEIIEEDVGDMIKEITFQIRVRPARQEDGLTYVVGCGYNPGAKAPEFERFVAEVLPDAAVREYVREYIGATLLPDTRYQTAQFWLGGGANGKSTLAEIVAALHAEVAAVELDQLAGFHLLPLLGASLAYVDETPSRIDEQKLKALISGGLVQVDRKYLPPVSLRPRAKWLICGNRLPAVSDQSMGFWRRLPVVPFTTSIPTEKRDLLLARRIIENELPGVLNWALGGLVSLLVRGRIAPMPQAVAQAVAGGKSETNSVLAWVEADCIETVEGAEAVKEDVYRVYKDWCRDNSMQALASPRFWARLADVLGELKITQPRRGGKQVRCVPLRIPEKSFH